MNWGMVYMNKRINVFNSNFRFEETTMSQEFNKEKEQHEMKKDTIFHIMDIWKDKKKEKSITQKEMIKYFFIFINVELIIFLGLIFFNLRFRLEVIVIYWYLSIFVLEFISLMYLATKYSFSDEEDKVLNVVEKIVTQKENE